MDIGEFSGNKPENGVHHFYTHCIDQKVVPPFWGSLGNAVFILGSHAPAEVLFLKKMSRILLEKMPAVSTSDSITKMPTVAWAA